jgi:hypothetical protein
VAENAVVASRTGWRNAVISSLALEFSDPMQTNLA